MSTDIDSIKRKLLIKYPTFGSVIANIEFQASKDIETAGTDGKVLLYNPKFLGGLSEKQQIFIFAHEICHVAFEHIFRSEGKDKRLWNIATDSVINALLKQDGLPIVEGGVDIPEAINYDAEEMYNKLLEEKKKQEQQNSQGNQRGQNSQNSQEQQDSQGNRGGQNSQNSQEQQDSQGNRGGQNSQNSQEQQDSQGNQGQQNSQNIQEHQDSQDNRGRQSSQDSQEQQDSQDSQRQQNSQDSQEEQNAQDSQGGQNSQSGLEETDIGHDTHSLWDKAIEERKQQEQVEKKGQEQRQTKKKEKKERTDGEEQGEKKKREVKEKSKFAKQGERETFKQNKIERRKQLQELSRELANKSSHEAGDGIQREGKKLSDIGIATPLIDWRKLLRQAIRYDEEYTRKNARMRNGYFRHRIEQLPMPEAEILLDTSGSVSEVLLKNFLRECKNILDNSKVKVGCFNTEFHGFTELKRPEDIDNMSFPIGGGTNFDVAVRAFSRKAPNKIIFTDGQADMPKETVRNVIWVVFGNEKINPKGGKVINITGEQLKKLYQSFIKYNDDKSR